MTRLRPDPQKTKLTPTDWITAGLSVLVLGASLLFSLSLFAAAILGVIWLFRQVF